MLNPALYKAIAAVFKQTPRIINEEGAAEVSYPPPRVSFLDTVTQIPTKNIRGGEQYAVCCPFCGDKRHRLYFSYLWGAPLQQGTLKYVCSKSLVRCFNEECQRIPANRQYILDNLSAALADSTITNGEIVINEAVEDSSDNISNQVPLPDNLVDIDDKTVPDYVRHYWLDCRNFTVDTLKKFGVKFTYLRHPVKAGAPLCRQMVTVVPVIQNGDYWFHQLRLIPIDGDEAKGYEKDDFGVALPKYIIPKGSRKSWALYNIDKASSKPTVFVTEGVTDVWRIGTSAIARFGKTLSHAQTNAMILKLAGKDIVFVPDMDDPNALELAIEQQEALRNTGVFKSVEVSVMDKGMDPANLKGGNDEVCRYLKEHIYSQDEGIPSLCGIPAIL